MDEALERILVALALRVESIQWLSTSGGDGPSVIAMILLADSTLLLIHHAHCFPGNVLADDSAPCHHRHHPGSRH